MAASIEMPSHLDKPCEVQSICGGTVLLHAYRTSGGKFRFGRWQIDFSSVPMTGHSKFVPQLDEPPYGFATRMFDSLDELKADAENLLHRLYG